MSHIKTNIDKIFFRLQRKLTPLNTIEINKQALIHNLNYVKKICPDKTIFPVLKSNAYGHDLSKITSILKDYTDMFAVDSFYEALQIKNISPKAKILLIGSINPVNLHLLDLKDISLTLQDKQTLNTLIFLKKDVSVHIKVNTGMNRQGIGPSELPYFLSAIKNSHIKLDGVFSHLSDADNLDNQYSQRQHVVFKECLKQVKSFGFSPRYIHLSATAGIPKIKDRQINAIRLGIGLYGYNPFSKGDKLFVKLNPIKPALSFHSSIIRIQHLKKGDQVSYNRTFTAPNDMTIGTISAGYFEGIDKRLSNTGFIKYKNRFLPIIGQVCMNLTIVNFKHTNPKLFDRVEVISSNPNDLNSIQNIAIICNTIPYDILVHLNYSIKRIVI